MRRILQIGVLVSLLAPAANAYCTTSGQPATVMLASQILEIQDDAAYKAGQDVWVPAGVKADAQIHTWLVWSSQPGGQNCLVTFEGVRNDNCGPRVEIQFEQRTPYNAGISAADMPGGSTAYPYSCTVELIFHIYDMTPIPNPDLKLPPLVDPGFNFYTLVDLRVTGEHYVNPGGVGTVPIGVSRQGCPQAQAGDHFPAYMLEGPGCPGANAQINAAGSRTAKIASPTGAFIRAATRAKLSNTLAQMAANTRTLNGRPVIRQQQR